MPGHHAYATVQQQPYTSNEHSHLATSRDEQSIPPFQDFIKRMPPAPQVDKALPPFPFMLRSYSNESLSQSRSRTTASSSRRSSLSVYSRTTNQWHQDDLSLHSSDFADEPLPSRPKLRPLSNSASTPDLSIDQATLPLLLPAKYVPKAATSTPDLGVTNSTAAFVARGSNTLMSKEKKFTAELQVMKTVPLERAIAAVHSPGAIHLLPEELRAQTASKPKIVELTASGPLRMVSTDLISWEAISRLTEVPDLPKIPSHLKALPPRQDGHLLPLGNMSIEAHAGDSSPSFRFGHSSDLGVVVKKAPWRASLEVSKTDRNGGDLEEPRGRTRHHVSRSSVTIDYLTNGKRMSTGTLRNGPLTAERFAEQYRAVIPDEAARLRDTLRYPHYYSGPYTNAHLVPLPLRNSKTVTKSKQEIDNHPRTVPQSPYSLSVHIDSLTKPDLNNETSSNQYGTHKRTNTSGSIPISPPMPMTPLTTAQPQPFGVETAQLRPKPKRPDIKKRESAYYPYVGPRRQKGSKLKVKARAANNKAPPVPKLDLAGARKTSNSSDSHETFATRLAKNAAKYADLLSRSLTPPESPYEPITSATVSPGSPHLAPSPTPPKAVHLGWSDTAKSAFDKMTLPSTPSSRPPSGKKGQLFTHIAAPARPLDESGLALREIEPRRKSSIFGGFLENWKEAKAEKRREELRKNIRVLPLTD